MQEAKDDVKENEELTNPHMQIYNHPFATRLSLSAYNENTNR